MFSILLFRLRCGYLTVSLLWVSLFELHLRRSSAFYDFTSIATTLSAYHDHQRCDFHPRLRFRPAIWAAGLPLAFAADSSIRNQRIVCLPWASIPACDDYGTCDSQSLQDFIVALRFCSTILRSITEVISADVFSCICRLLSAFNLVMRWGSQSLTRFLFDYWLHHPAGLQLPHRRNALMPQRFTMTFR
jgi:hypothetical protein